MHGLRYGKRMEIQAVIVFWLGCMLCLAGIGTAQAQTPGEEPGTGAKGLFLPFVVNSAPRDAFGTGEAMDNVGQDVETGTGPSLPLVVNNAPHDAFGTMDLLDEVVSDANAGKGSRLSVIVDTDPGVDDALALVYLFSQHQRPVDVLGIVTVAGNTNVDSATNNVLNILKQVGMTGVPVVRGAEKPISRTLSKSGWFIHGPDGLWFSYAANPGDLIPQLMSDPSAFYCENAGPGVTILALGPLTNLANAITNAKTNDDSDCVNALESTNIVVLGSAKFGGNKTPVTEYNFWQDPEAADIILTAGFHITVVPFDAFTQVTVDQKDIDKLIAKGNPAIKTLGAAITTYVKVQIDNTGKATIPDAVAAAYMLNSSVGLTQSALIKIVPDGGPAGGQSIVGLSTAERIAMVVPDEELSNWAFCTFICPGFNLFAEIGKALYFNPDNAQFVTVVKANLLTKTVLPVMRND